MNQKNKSDKNSNILGIVLLVVMFVFFIVFRQFYQQGQKLLEGLHPWDYIALVVIVGLLGIFLVKKSKNQK